MLKRHLPTVLLALAVFIAVQAWQTRNTPDQAPAALMDWIDQQPALRGEPVIGVYVWAEWCTICKLQRGSIDSVQSDSALATVAMRSGDQARVDQSLAQHTLDWATLADPNGEISTALGATVVPYFLVIDRTGRILSSTAGWSSPWGLRLRLWIGSLLA